MQSLTIRDFTHADAEAFYAINAAWIGSMFVLEAHDAHVLGHPQAMIDGGGAILIAETPEHGVIGTCALMQTAPGAFELTKMGVREDVRGLKAGEALLRAALARAAALQATTLYLLTSSRCAPAIHLYGKLGFVHDAAILRDLGGTYARCDVAMRHAGTATPAAYRSSSPSSSPSQ